MVGFSSDGLLTRFRARRVSVVNAGVAASPAGREVPEWSGGQARFPFAEAFEELLHGGDPAGGEVGSLAGVAVRLEKLGRPVGKDDQLVAAVEHRALALQAPEQRAVRRRRGGVESGEDAAAWSQHGENGGEFHGWVQAGRAQRGGAVRHSGFGKRRWRRKLTMSPLMSIALLSRPRESEASAPSMSEISQLFTAEWLPSEPDSSRFVFPQRINFWQVQPGADVWLAPATRPGPVSRSP